MTFRNLAHAISVGAAMLLISAGASAATIDFSTNVAGTGFGGGASLTELSSFGAGSTLVFTPNVAINQGVPSNVNYGLFTLTCHTCSTQAIGAGSFYNAFTIDLVITDTTDGATGKFVGTSTGGTVYSDVSLVTVNWTPMLQIGPGTTNAQLGNFGSTYFTINTTTAIVAPNSGSDVGQSTVQGFVGSTATPEPATLGLIGGALLGLSLLRRKSLR